MIVIGLTGGMASGKSTAARHLQTLGAHVIDADVLGHRAYEPGTRAFSEVVNAFGSDIVDADGRIDRKILGGKVFGQPDSLAKLTNIVWPEIRRMAEAEIESVRKADPSKVIVLEAAVLFEAGWEDAVGEIWVVSLDRDAAAQRAGARDGVDQAAVQKRIDAQMTNEERVKRGEIIIDNSGSLADLLTQLDTQWQRIEHKRAREVS
ncbi:MAG: dephospho-CoA kinase [Gammaproteobacteria bacterium]|nr:dephospho-CoA kinase [Gammaproteobacteria bacterium]